MLIVHQIDTGIGNIIWLIKGFEKIYYEEDFDNGSKTSELYKFMKVE